MSLLDVINLILFINNTQLLESFIVAIMTTIIKYLLLIKFNIQK